MLGGFGRGLPEALDLLTAIAVALRRERPQLDRLVSLVAVRADRLRGHAHRSSGVDRLDLLAEAHRQRASGDEVDLLDLAVPMAAALLEVGVGRDPDQGDRQ